MRRVAVAVAAFATVFVSMAGTASADTRATQLFGPFVSYSSCNLKQKDVEKYGWTVTVPCHASAPFQWWFKATN